MIYRDWEPLKPGDIVDVIAPGYPCTKEELENGLAFLRKWGLVPRVSKEILTPFLMHAAPDDIRIRDAVHALMAKDSKAIWCIRGGYGSNRIIPELLKLKKNLRSKLLIGISDITSIHLFLNQKWQWPTIHGPLLDRCGKGQLSSAHEKELKQIVFGQLNAIEMPIKPMNDLAKKVKKLEGPVYGGNLTVLVGHWGTPLQPSLKDSFLFVEDLGERGYRLDRMMVQIEQSGALKDCKGIILGDFLGGPEPSTGKDNFKQVFARWSEELKIPLFAGLPAGHGQIQRPIPFHKPCQILQKNGKYLFRAQYY